MRRVGFLMLVVLWLLSGRAGNQLAESPPIGHNQPAENPSAARDQPATADETSTSPANTSLAKTEILPPSQTAGIGRSAEDICHALEQNAATYGLPVEFFARVIWQESRFNARAVSPQGALGIAQFMPRTAQFRGLADPLDPIEALKNSASYLHDLRAQFGSLGLAAAAYNAGPGRVSEWLAKKALLPGETRDYVATVTGWTADEWASASPPKISEVTIPQEIPCARLANLMLAPKAEQQRIVAYIPRWGMQLTAAFTENEAWALYRPIQKQYTALIGNREPMVVAKRNISFNNAMRYNIRIADDDKDVLDKLCAKLTSAGAACFVLRND